MMESGTNENVFGKVIGENRNLIAAAAHLTAFLVLLPVPFVNLAAVVILWLIPGKHDELVQENGKEAFGFQVSLYVPCYLVLHFLQVMLFRHTGMISLVSAAIVVVLLLWSAAGAFGAFGGRVYRYPLSLLRLPWQTYTETLQTINRKTEARMQAQNALNGPRRFPALRIVASVLTIVAVLALVFGCVVCIAAVANFTVKSRDFAPVVVMLPSGLGALVAGILVLAGAESIRVLLAIENNTRVTTMLLSNLVTGTSSIQPESAMSSPSFRSSPAPQLRCSNCGQSYGVDMKGQYCQNCGAVID